MRRLHSTGVLSLAALARARRCLRTHRQHRNSQSTHLGPRSCRRTGSPASSAASARPSRTTSTWSTGATSPTRRRRPRSPRRRSSSSTSRATSSAPGATRPRCPIRSTAASSTTTSNVCVAGNADGIVQKYAPDGKLLLQIGTRGKFDSVDGTRRGKGNNAAHDQLHMPSASWSIRATATSMSPTATATGASWCSTRPASSCGNGDARQPRRKRRRASPGVFAEVVHCIAMSNAGLDLCLRPPGQPRAGVPEGRHVRPQHPDPEQERQAARQARHGVVGRVLARPRAEVPLHDERRHRAGAHPRSRQRQNPVELRPAGHQIGNFTHGHTIAVDSKGSIYVAETDWGRRIQKFKIVQ